MGVHDSSLVTTLRSWQIWASLHFVLKAGCKLRLLPAGDGQLPSVPRRAALVLLQSLVRVTPPGWPRERNCFGGCTPPGFLHHKHIPLVKCAHGSSSNLLHHTMRAPLPHSQHSTTSRMRPSERHTRASPLVWCARCRRALTLRKERAALSMP